MRRRSLVTRTPPVLKKIIKVRPAARFLPGDSPPCPSHHESHNQGLFPPSQEAQMKMSKSELIDLRVGKRTPGS